MVRKIRGVWCTDFRFEGKRHRRKSPDNSRKGAEAYELFLKQKLMRGETIEEPKKQKRSFDCYKDFADEWMKIYVQSNNKPSEVRKKRQTLDVHLLPVFGKLTLEEIDALAIERFKTKKVKQGLSPKTVNNHLSILRKSLSCAKDWGYLDRLPTFKWLKTVQPKINFLVKREQDLLLAGESEPRWNLMILMGLRTGMRVGEMLALHWKDVDLAQSQICVRYSLSDKEITSTKNNRIRYIPVGAQLATALRDWKASCKPKRDDLVFGIGKTPMTRFGAYDALERICARVGVRRIGWHTLRHTFATNLVAKQVPLRAVQELLGHSSITMTERYAHVSAGTLRSAVASLEGELMNFGHYMGTSEIAVPVLAASSSVGQDE